MELQNGRPDNTEGRLEKEPGYMTCWTGWE